MKYYTKKIGDIGPFEIIGTGDPQDCVGLIDRTGRWIISPTQGYKSFIHYNDGLMIAFKPENYCPGWVLIDYHGNCISDRYNYIEPAGEGFYMVEKGARHNIMRRDGSLVLKEWPHRVWKVRDGYFPIEKTIPKTKTTPTRYVAGVAHVSGIIVFPMIFDSVNLFNDPGDTDMLVKKDGQPFIINNGALFDLQKRHYPPKSEPDKLDKFFEQIVNWILPGLQMFYRDTDADIDAGLMYPVGKVIRTGFYTSVSTKLHRPAQKTRFLIASAHAALLCSDETGNLNKTGLIFSPRAEEWRHAVISKNAWLKVLDIYKVGDVTQIFMIQIPETAAMLLGDSKTVFNFINEAGGSGNTLVETARRCFEEKMREFIHPRSTDTDWIELMAQPVGYTTEGKPYSINPDFTLDEDPFSSRHNTLEHNRDFCKAIHYFADDRDIVHDYDGFPWRGVVGSVCDGCMYAYGTNGHPFGCGRLFQNSFRKSYISGCCDFWKLSLGEESDFERARRMERERLAEHQSKTSGAYAYSLMADFIKEHLNNNIDNLLHFDFTTLKEDTKYGPIKGPSIVTHYAIVKSIVELAFGDYWHDLNVETLDTYQYQIGTIIHYQRIAGCRIANRLFKSLNKYCPLPELIDLAEELYSKVNTIGDFIVWPNKAIMANMFDDSKMRGYIDRIFIAMYEVMTDAPKQDMKVKAALHTNRNMMKGYQGEKGFVAFMKNALLDGFIHEDGSPKSLFYGLSNSARDFRPEHLPDALRQYHDFMIPTVEWRSRKILERLKRKLGSPST